MKFDQKNFYDFVIENDVVGFWEKPIKLKSGRESNWYVNWRSVFEDAFLIDQLSDFVLSFLEKEKISFDCCYGIPEGATKLSIIVQFKFAKKSKYFSRGSHILPMGRAKPKEHGELKDKFFVGMPKGDVVVLEDVTTTGVSLLETIDSLKKVGVNIVCAIGLTNRMELRDDGKSVEEAIAEKRIKYYALSDATVLLPKVVKKNKPGSEIIDSVEKEFEKYGVERLKLK